MVTDVPHRRFDPLRGRWVLVSAGRDTRPWKGDVEPPPPLQAPRHDPGCHLCPGNERAGGRRNPDYTGVHAFTNDFPALRPDARDVGAHPGECTTAPARGRHPLLGAHPLLRAEAEAGTCRVLCYSPRHDASLTTMAAPAVRAVVDLWAEQIRELERDWRWVQVFENRGTAMGASSPHPHGQVWASASLPDEPRAEDARQRAYLADHGRPLLDEYAELEDAADERIVVAGDAWLAVVPFWAVWPFETLLLPRSPRMPGRAVTRMPELDDADRDDLVDVLRRLLAAYDALFHHPFPYSMGWHGAPGPTPGSDRDADSADGPDSIDGRDLDRDRDRHRHRDPDLDRDRHRDRDRDRHWRLHAHFYPPLLRSPTVRKFLVGYEMLAGVQRDIAPETAAARLRACVPAHLP
jgi:UDPglucose--hexose-1-phosphate uridylyltransferase